MGQIRLSARPLRALFLCFSVPLIAGMVGCGSDTSAPTVSIVSSAGQASDGLTSAQSAPVTVQLTPAFDVAIHDYVIQCATSPNILLSVTLPEGMMAGLIGPSGVTLAPAAYPSGEFQQTIAISAGQRFQLSLSGQSDNYSVRCLPADFPSLSTSFVTGNELAVLEKGEYPFPLAQWYVFALDLQAVTTVPGAPSYVIIADAHGTPVWWEREPLGWAFDAKILSSSQIVWTVYGENDHYIRDFSGNLLNTLSANLDDHEFQVTPSGTFLAIQTVPRICPPDCADMSPWGGPSKVGVVDAQIVEIDSNSNVLWTWKTRDHIALSETGEESWYPSVGSDIIHMNAVEPDGNDAVLFSARHLNAIYRIIKSTGAIDWKIGGSTRAESLVVTGDTRPTALGPKGYSLNGQHDVRKWPDGTISVHDNGTLAGRPPFVVRYQVDTTSRTAEVVEEFSDSRIASSLCCGSARRLPGGHWLVDWGDNSLFTEMVAGEPVLTVKYSGTGVFSYRAVPVLPGVVATSTLRDGMDAMASE